MRRCAVVFLVLLLCCGCATSRPGETGGFLQRHLESRRLASALTLLGKGDGPAAARILEAICADPPAAGVTDEALFRLALLSLRPSAERPASPRGHQLLKRLATEYPDSPWTAQAAPLVELIGSAEELRRQNRNLRTTNQSLAREASELKKNVKELNRNIEELKHLDLEIEKKTR